VAIVVVGGQSRNLGKTSVVAGLIARLPERRWTAFKVTQYGHGFCTANGAPCACATADHTLAVSEERSSSSGTDTARFLAAGAARSIWVRTRRGMLAEAMPRIRKELATAENAILESNSVMGFLEPDVYLTVLDVGTADFKDSARLFLERADAVLVREAEMAAEWTADSAKLLEGKPRFVIGHEEYVTDAVAAFVRERIAGLKATVVSL
jgi:molybdopterin-guanine dinucleotide biosynthesis protein